jgi:outer membrane receptor protein involved in Fe transport
MRQPILVTICVAAFACGATSAQAQSGREMLEKTVKVDIRPQKVSTALIELSQQAGIQVLMPGELVEALDSGGVSGEMTVQEAVARLLEGTKLRFHEVGANAIGIGIEGDQGNVGNNLTGIGIEGVDFRFAQQEGNRSPSGATEATGENGVQEKSKGEEERLEEVVVTARKRAERLQEVPLSVTAINAESLADRHQLRLQDYYQQIPGLNFVTAGPGLAQMAIRGVTTGGSFTNPTVGVTVDDVPYGASSGLAFAGLTVPDLDPSDLRRIEVLRGPQGTLYGAASIGGLVKYVTADPSVDRVSGRLQAELNSVHNGDGEGYGARGAINVPLSETLAVRLSGAARRDPGYVDDPVNQIEGVNQQDAYSGRLSALWSISDSSSLKVAAQFNEITADGNSDVNLQLGSGQLLQNILPGHGGYSQQLQLYTGTFTTELADVDLISISGYQINEITHKADYTPFYGRTAPTNLIELVFPGVGGAGNLDDLDTKKLTQELRLSSKWGTSLEWLLGAFYTHEDNVTDQLVYGADEQTGESVGLAGDFRYPTTFNEVAAFAGLTVHVTERFDVQFGGRQSENRQRYEETDTGPFTALFFGLPSPVTIPPVHTKDGAFTYLVTPRFTLSPDLMVYARLASGYRPGGPNPYSSAFGFPTEFGSDKTKSYELGVKGAVLDNRVSFDLSAYYIDWRNIQITVLDSLTFFTYFTNASSAKSEGVELALQARPLGGLTISSSLAWNEAELTSDLPTGNGSAIGFSGDRLPFSSKLSGAFSLDDRVKLTDRVTGFVGGSVTYTGKREGSFAGNFSQTRAALPGYTKIDLRAGVEFGDWVATLFANNIADKRGVLNITPVGTATTFHTYVQPRTIGLSVARTF